MNEKQKPAKDNLATDPTTMGGITYDGIVDIEEVIIDDELYEINEAD